MAFSRYEGDFPELRSDWWKTRSHDAPLGVRTEKHKHFFTALDNLEVQCRNSPEMVPSSYRV